MKIEALQLQGGVKTMKRTEICPLCGRSKTFFPCLTCNGTGKVKVTTTIPGQWNEADLRRNPYLPYYSKPQPITTTTSQTCKTCNGKGEYSFHICGLRLFLNK